MPSDWPAETSPSTVKMPANLCRASDLAQAATAFFRDRRCGFGARGGAAKCDAVKSDKALHGMPLGRSNPIPHSLNAVK